MYPLVKKFKCTYLEKSVLHMFYTLYANYTQKQRSNGRICPLIGKFKFIHLEKSDLIQSSGMMKACPEVDLIMGCCMLEINIYSELSSPSPVI